MPNMTFEEAVDAAKDGADVQIKCPAHDDGTASLHVCKGDRQPVRFMCHAGCAAEDIIAASDLTWADVCEERTDPSLVVGAEVWTPKGNASHVYQYVDEVGTLLFEVLRVPQPNGKKAILQRQPNPAKDNARGPGYDWNLDGVRRTLYNLPDVIEAVKAGMTIHIAEGEKCADALNQVLPEGEVATTSPGGAGKWHDDYAEVLAGASVVIYADLDAQGRAHAREVRESLLKVEARPSIVEPTPGVMLSGKEIKDIADTLEAGGQYTDVLVTMPFEDEQGGRTAVDLIEAMERPNKPIEWVVPGLLAKRDRAIMVATEGMGKSMWLRQFAVCVAAGLHPFQPEKLIEPKKVLYIDLENDPDQVRTSYRDLVGLCALHGAELQPGMFHILEEFDSEHDLTKPEGRAWLMERMHAYTPDLTLLGPISYAAYKDMADAETVRRLKDTINHARRVSDSAFLMEHHAPQRAGGDKKREIRPYGSSMFLRWPEFGLSLEPVEGQVDTFKLGRWRGDRVRQRQWPDAVRAGNRLENSREFPFMATELLGV